MSDTSWRDCSVYRPSVKNRPVAGVTIVCAFEPVKPVRYRTFVNRVTSMASTACSSIAGISASRLTR